MKFDLKTPCKHCPFRTDETAIRFSCAERAEEIAESAYRNGFPCHLSAEHSDDDEYGGFYPGENTQHCAGAIIMFLKEGYGEWPGIDNDEDLLDRLAEQVDLTAPVFDTETEFIEASSRTEAA